MNNPAEISEEELLAEKDLLSVYKAARVIRVSRLNQLVSVFTCALLAAFAFFNAETNQQLAERVRDIANYGFGFATSILSFLIAGFTIYLTVAKPSLLVFLASNRNPQSGLPEIKHIAFLFMRTMVNYIVFCMICIGIKLFGATGGPLIMVVEAISGSPTEHKRLLASIGLIFVGTFLIHLVMLLQSFVFNIYHTAMTSVVYERIQAKNSKAVSN